MERSPLSESDGFSASQEIPTFYKTRKFITVFTKAYHVNLSWTIVPKGTMSWDNFLGGGSQK